ncbi:MAG: DUF938 domain-containing protein [Pseudomonadota bacterium]
MIRKPPPTASIVQPGTGAKMHAPAAERNVDALCALLQRLCPEPGDALELASGTGQHVIRFAAQHPSLHWQPTEPDRDRRNSIDAWATEAGLPNIAPAQPLDACAPGWSARWPDRSLIIVVNLLHLISTPDAQTLVREAALALAPKGTLLIYGPFMRNGALTSEGDARFHASLVETDPDIGYKSDRDLMAWLALVGLPHVDLVEMPANNLGVIAKRTQGDRPV